VNQKIPEGARFLEASSLAQWLFDPNDSYRKLSQVGDAALGSSA